MVNFISRSEKWHKNSVIEPLGNWMQRMLWVPKFHIKASCGSKVFDKSILHLMCTCEQQSAQRYYSRPVKGPQKEKPTCLHSLNAVSHRRDSRHTRGETNGGQEENDGETASVHLLHERLPLYLSGGEGEVAFSLSNEGRSFSAAPVRKPWRGRGRGASPGRTRDAPLRSRPAAFPARGDAARRAGGLSARPDPRRPGRSPWADPAAVPSVQGCTPPLRPGSLDAPAPPGGKQRPPRPLVPPTKLGPGRDPLSAPGPPRQPHSPRRPAALRLGFGFRRRRRRRLLHGGGGSDGEGGRRDQLGGGGGFSHPCTEPRMAAAGSKLQPGAGDRSPGVQEWLGPASASSPPQEPLAPRPSWRRRPASAGLRRVARDKLPKEAAAGAGMDRRGRPGRGGEGWRRGRPGGRQLAGWGSGALPRGLGLAAAAVWLPSRGVCGGLCAPVLPGGQRGACTEGPGKGIAAWVRRRLLTLKCFVNFSKRIVAKRRCHPQKQGWM